MLQKMKAIASDAVKPSPKAVASRIFKLIAAVLVIALSFSAVLYAAHTIRITDGKNTYVMTTVFETPESTAKKVAAADNFRVESVTPGLYSTDVVISYNLDLAVTLNNKTRTYNVTSGVLKDILNSIGVYVDEYDIVTPSLDTVITESSVVDIVDVEYKTEVITEEIPFDNSVEYSDELYASTQKFEEGSAGSKVVTHSVMYVNGVATEKTVLNEQVISPAVDSKTVIGTKTPYYASSAKTVSTISVPDDLILDENGIPVNYKSAKTLRATAYTHTGNRCATGVKPEPGYVAVDPNEIPYGTRMYIVSSDGRYNYGYAIAADTGGFTKGNRTDMDLFMNTKSQCINFGRRNITVYFLD